MRRMPEVARVIATPFVHGPLQLRERWKLSRTLKNYDQAYVLPNSWKSALIPFFALLTVCVTLWGLTVVLPAFLAAEGRQVRGFLAGLVLLKLAVAVVQMTALPSGLHECAPSSLP